MGKRTFWIILAVIVAAGGLILLTGKKSDAPGSSQTALASEHVEGNPDSKVVLIEYGDFQCPACGNYYPILKQLRLEYADRIKFQFRHFPIVQIHPNAMAAHRAAEAAGKQGKFFEMHDLLYENQQSWSSLSSVQGVFENYAKQLGLNMEQYAKDLSSSEVADVINADIKEGKSAGAESTPTFVLNGKKIENPRSYEDFKKILDEAIKAMTSAE